MTFCHQLWYTVHAMRIERIRQRPVTHRTNNHEERSSLIDPATEGLMPHGALPAKPDMGHEGQTTMSNTPINK